MLRAEIPQRSEVNISVYNQLGQMVYSARKPEYSGALQEQITLHQPAGIYFLQLSFDSRVLNEKMVIEDLR
jgi:hypothetical protein